MQFFRTSEALLKKHVLDIAKFSLITGGRYGIQTEFLSKIWSEVVCHAFRQRKCLKKHTLKQSWMEKCRFLQKSAKKVNFLQMKNMKYLPNINNRVISGCACRHNSIYLICESQETFSVLQSGVVRNYGNSFKNRCKQEILPFSNEDYERNFFHYKPKNLLNY